MSGAAIPWMMLTTIVLAGGLIGYLLLRNRWYRALAAVALGHVLGAIALWLSVQLNPHAEGVMRVAFLVMFVLPSLIGLLGGAGLGWLRGRRGVADDDPGGSA